jgi:hypothetical protein
VTLPRTALHRLAIIMTTIIPHGPFPTSPYQSGSLCNYLTMKRLMISVNKWEKGATLGAYLLM